MKKITNIALFTGGESSEHEVTLRSTEMLRSALQKIPDTKVIEILINKDGSWSTDSSPSDISHQGHLIFKGESLPIHYAIPYIHGNGGETGHLSALLEIHKIPFFGPSHESAISTFNKIATKLWCDRLQIPNTPYYFLVNQFEASMEKAAIFLKENGTIFVKASHQGSSVGCYKVDTFETLETSIKSAFELSPYVLLEKAIKGRELEVSAFEYQGELHITPPGEICPPDFYNYEEKYSETSKTTTTTVAENLDPVVLEKIERFSRKVFESFKLKDLARIDFFLHQNNQVYLNEINTLPGLTPISMFPKMMEAYGVKFEDFIKNRVESSL